MGFLSNFASSMAANLPLLGVVVTYTPLGGEAIPDVDAVASEGTTLRMHTGTGDADTTVQTISVPLTAVSTPAKGDTIAVPDAASGALVNWNVSDVLGRSGGLVRLEVVRAVPKRANAAGLHKGRT